MEEINATNDDTPAAPPPGSGSFSLSEAAMKRIAHLLSDEPEGTRFIVGVWGGGCSGFQYQFDLKQQDAEPGDVLIDAPDTGKPLVLVEEVALPFLNGAELDYQETLAKAGFEISNPNAAASCGCGNSFSVKF